MKFRLLAVVIFLLSQFVLCVHAADITISTNRSTVLNLASGNNYIIDANISTSTYGLRAPFFENIGQVTINATKSVSASDAGIRVDYASISTLTNNGAIGNSSYLGTNYGTGIWLYGGLGSESSIQSLVNTGSIQVNNGQGSLYGSAIYVDVYSSINSIENTATGTIDGTGGIAAIQLSNVNSSIGTITNLGSIIGGSDYGIYNLGTIGTINNAQGAGNSNGVLTYKGNLPTNYNIIIGSLTEYGRLVGYSINGQTTFGIYSGSTLAVGRYYTVLTGLASSNLTSTSGSVSGFNWSLVNAGSSSIWDLLVTLAGPSAADTQSSLEVSANRLKSIYNLQSTALVNGLTYDCQVFDVNNICLSTGGRYSNNHGAYGNTTSALLIGAYRLNKNVRLGAWIDQNLSANTTAGVNLGNSKPLFGVFGAWAENQTGKGYEVKVSAGYGDKDLTVTRDVIGGSEAGMGTSRLNSQAVSTVSSYGFRINNELLASPYVGVRYSRIASNGYTEATSSDVTAPLTYSKLTQENTALMAGLKLSAKLDPKTTLVASAGIEQNLKNRSGQYSATGVDGLAPVEFNSNPQKTKAAASVGAYYDIDKTQRVAVNGIYREETFNPTATTSVLATYTAGF